MHKNTYNQRNEYRELLRCDVGVDRLMCGHGLSDGESSVVVFIGAAEEFFMSWYNAGEIGMPHYKICESVQLKSGHPKVNIRPYGTMYIGCKDIVVFENL